MTKWLAVVAVIGCAAPEVGPLNRDSCVDYDSDPERGVSFAADVAPLLRRDAGGCVHCHAPDATNPTALALTGLDVSSYATLTAAPHVIVVPFQPCASLLVDKLGRAPSTGARMPMNGPPFWTAAERALVADWIAEGADDN
jgi:hypothetical protein